MIAQLTGTVAAVGGTWLVVDLSGFGLKALCTPATAARAVVGETVTLHTSLVVREDSLTLYGFADDDERATFETLQTVSGIGPRLALAMLAVHEPEALRRAVATDDLAALRKVPGVGLKGAQRMVLELKGKLGLPGAVTPAADQVPAPDDDTWRGQVREALVGLGWAAKAAEEAIARVAPAAGEPVDVPAVLRAALQRLGRA